MFNIVLGGGGITLRNITVIIVSNGHEQDFNRVSQMVLSRIVARIAQSILDTVLGKKECLMFLIIRLLAYLYREKNHE